MKLGAKTKMKNDQDGIENVAYEQLSWMEAYFLIECQGGN